MQLTHEDAAILNQWWVEKSRVNFFAYRRYMRANEFLYNWFLIDVSRNLQQFYVDLLAGKKPILVIQTPPQHGKTWSVVDFIGWLAGKHPNLRTIYASFSDTLGVRANLQLQRTIDSGKFQDIFKETRLAKSMLSAVDMKAQRNKNLLEFVGKQGSFRNTTVGGPVTGETLDLGVIDDPIKGREQANSKTYLDKIWDWFTDDFNTRFSEDAGLLIIMTRWNVNDLVGRLIKQKGARVKVLNYSAIATQDELHRSVGDPLFPALKSLDFLLDKKGTMALAHWDALYQGAPVVIGGNLFKDTWWKYYKTLPKMQWRIIYADTALKAEEQHDYTVFQCWGMSYDRKIFLIDMVRDKVEAPQLLTMAKAFWNKHRAIQGHGVLRSMKIEDKASGIGLIQTLRQDGVAVKGIQRSRDKVSRANDVLPEIEVGNVYLPEDAPWLSDYLTETNAFPNGEFDDQVDPTMDAIEDMLISGVQLNYEDML